MLLLTLGRDPILQRGDTNKALIDATQAGAFVVEAALLFTPAAPVGAVIIIIAGSSDLIQSAFDK